MKCQKEARKSLNHSSRFSQHWFRASRKLSWAYFTWLQPDWSWTGKPAFCPKRLVSSQRFSWSTKESKDLAPGAAGVLKNPKILHLKPLESQRIQRFCTWRAQRLTERCPVQQQVILVAKYLSNCDIIRNKEAIFKGTVSREKYGVYFIWGVV